MTTALVIGRKRPGRPIDEAVAETERLLDAGGWTVQASVVKRKKQLRKRVKAAVKAAIDVVVVVGGDGAVLQAVQRVATTEVPLGIVPLGTGNLLASNLEIPKALPDAVGVILGGSRRRIDVGRLTVDKKQRFFSVACGVGFDASVMDATSMRSKRRLGKLAYVIQAARKSGTVRDVRHTITIDGKRTRIDAAQVLIANFGNTGLGFEPKLPMEPDDGQLDVIALRAPGRAAGLLAVWEALTQGQTGTSKGGRALRARAATIEIDARRKRLVEIDGSVIGTTPVIVSIEPRALTVLVPAGADGAEDGASADGAEESAATAPAEAP